MNAYEFIINLRDQATSNLRRIAQSIGVASDRSKEFTRDLKKNETASNSLGSALGGLRSKLIGLFAGISLMAFTNQVITARAEYEKFSAVLENTFQSKTVGDGALAMLTEFATKTPYQLNELTGGFIKLVNRGINPTYEEMTKIGDLASSQGKSFDQLVEAILDGQTGEFERLKEFGIKASKSGDKVTLSFKGITKEVANNEQALKDAIISYGGMKGVAGSMESVSKTLGGRLSNLSDQWWNFLVAVGGYGGGVIGDTLQMMSDGLAFVQQYLPEIAHWFDLLGTYISAVTDQFQNLLAELFGINDATTAIQIFADTSIWALVIVSLLSDTIAWFLKMLSQNIEIVYGVIAAIAAYNVILQIMALRLAFVTWWTGTSTAAIILNTLVTEGWAAAWLAVNIAMSANPIGLVILAIAALVGIIVFAWNKFGWFRGAVLGTWEVLKGFGTMIKNYVINRFTELLKGITGIGQALVAFFKGDWKTAWEIGKKSAGQLMGADSAAKALQDGKAAFGNFNKGWEEGNKNQPKKSSGGLFSDRSNEIKNSFKGIERPKQGDPKDYLNGIGKNKGITAPGADKNKDEKKKDKDGIVSGGSKQTHITINIGKLNEKIEVHTTNLKEGGAEIEAKIQELLLRAVNSVNQMQTG
ncbi:hypothetical protein [Chryseobacterium salviniae]|uniref:Tape measure domain-containing protein n=1 Tax=Chryseobacterium salviniae TaxID=3101750 RepID=A0ABU6HS94_9FLAO|nr:hypothetical protein [Chryseobacterium sp. T9W2-O]MEC3875934.1 hypothetical protein [Chryseobacterium sp. T9W2-O]